MTAAKRRNLKRRTQASDSGRRIAGLGLEDSGGYRQRGSEPVEHFPPRALRAHLRACRSWPAWLPALACALLKASCTVQKPSDTIRGAEWNTERTRAESACSGTSNSSCVSGTVLRLRVSDGFRPSCAMEHARHLSGWQNPEHSTLFWPWATGLRWDSQHHSAKQRHAAEEKEQSQPCQSESTSCLMLQSE